METTPFLTADGYAALIAPRTLTAGERALVELLAQAVADWIRDPSRLPTLLTTDPLGKTQAKLVTFEVVSQALGPAGVDSRVKSYTATTDDRTTTVTYAEAVAIAASLLDGDQRYSKMLGLSVTTLPAATFDSFADAYVERDAFGARTW